MPFFFVLVLVIVVLVVLQVRDSHREHRAAQRNAQLRDLAGRLGFELTEEKAQVERLVAGTRLQRRSADAQQLLQGQRDGYRVSLFDLKDPHTTAIVVQREGAAFPRFCLQPRTALIPVAEMIAAEDATRYVTLADIGGRDALFGQDFQLDVHGDDLERLRARLSSGPARDRLATRRDASLFVTSTGDRLLLYVAGETTPSTEIEQRLSETLELVASLTSE